MYYYRLRNNRQALILTLIFCLSILYYLGPPHASPFAFGESPIYIDLSNSPWYDRPLRNKILNFQTLPAGHAKKLPKIQARFGHETSEVKATRLQRLQTIRQAFNHTWQGYRKHAWLADELRPLSGGTRDTFGNWSATLVDSLDTLWIMGFGDEFEEAVNAVASIDFSVSSSSSLSVFETTIRYLGGLLAAFDLSRNPMLLQKATELGNLLYASFDTPNRMPVRILNWQAVLDGERQEADFGTPSADIASLSLEFTRLAQLTGDHKFFDAVQRISDLLYKHQDNSLVPGLWPIFLNAAEEDFASGSEFTLNGMADSLYEYMPKMNLLLGGQKPEYAEMYAKFMLPAKEHLFYRPMTKNGEDVLLSGFVNANETNITLVPSGQHLGCFAGGMVAIGARTIGPASDIEVASKLADGCSWAYGSSLSGVMPETFAAAACISKQSCPWNESAWHEAVQNQLWIPEGASVEDQIQADNLPPGFTQIIDSRYLLRPEALESIFILYRVTSDTKWQDKAWKMFEAIDKAAKTELAYAQLADVSIAKPEKVDQMESFWTAETLKYLYLIFSEPHVIDLDEYVLNTEAHPFRRPRSVSWW